MIILGINGNILNRVALVNESSACIIKDGEIIAAVAQERVSREKVDGRFPIEAIKEVLSIAKISIEDVNYVASSSLHPYFNSKKYLKSILTTFFDSRVLLYSKLKSFSYYTIYNKLKTKSKIETDILGKKFDIHGGGMDLKFPHHECEIAQSEICNNSSPVNTWMHSNMLTLNGQKMAKSTGNFILPNDFFTGDSKHLSKSFSAGCVRFFILQAHYRSVLDFSNEALIASEKGYNKLMESIRILETLSTSSITSDFNVESWKENCYNAMNDDFNSPILIAELFRVVKFINQVKDGSSTVNKKDLEIIKNSINVFVFEILGLQNVNESANQYKEKLEETLELLIKMRSDARANKDFELSDKIRIELDEIGIQLKDSKGGTTFKIDSI